MLKVAAIAGFLYRLRNGYGLSYRGLELAAVAKNDIPGASAQVLASK